MRTQSLAAQGLSVFWDIKLHAGQTYREVLLRELTEAKCVIVAWSAHSVNSRWVIDEAERGLELRRLLPITLDGTLPPLGFRQIHAARLHNWRGELSDPQYTALVSSIRNYTDGLGAPQIGQIASPQRKAGTQIAKHVEVFCRFSLLLLTNVFITGVLGGIFALSYSALGLWQAAAIIVAVMIFLTGVSLGMDYSKGLTRWSIETDLEVLLGSIIILAAIWYWALSTPQIPLAAVLTFCLTFFPSSYLANYVIRTKMQ